MIINLQWMLQTIAVLSVIFIDGAAGQSSPSARQDRVYENCPFDLILVIDVSGYDPVPFNRTQEEIIKAVKGLPNVAFNLGIITFNEVTRIIRHLQPVDNITAVTEHIAGIQQRGGGTSALRGVWAAINMIESYSRWNAQKIVVLASDGNSGLSDTFQLVHQASARLNSLNRTKVMSVTHSPKYYLPEMKAYSGDDVFTASTAYRFEGELRMAAVHECDLRQMLIPLLPVIEPKGACNVDVHIIVDYTSSSPKDDIRTIQAAVTNSAIDHFSTESFGTLKSHVRVRVGVTLVDKDGIRVVKDIGIHSNKSHVIDTVKIGLNPELSNITADSGKTLKDALMVTAQQIRNQTRNRIAVVYIGDATTENWYDLTEAGNELRANPNTVVFTVTVQENANLLNLATLAGINNRVFASNALTHIGHRKLAGFLDDYYQYANDAGYCVQQLKRPNYNFCEIDLLMLMQTSGMKERELDDSKNVIENLMLEISPQDVESDRIALSIITTKEEQPMVMPFASWKKKEYVDLALTAIDTRDTTAKAPLISETMVAAINEALRSRRNNALLLILFIGNGKYESETYQQIRDTCRIWDRLPNTMLMAVGPSKESYGPALAAITGNPDLVYTNSDGRRKFMTAITELINVPECVNSRPVILPGGIQRR